MKTLTSMFRIALGLLALVFTATMVKAKEDGDKERKPSKEAMAKYDANKDGMLDDAEKAAMKAGAVAKGKATREANLAKYDANKDGKLDETEKAAMKADLDAAKDAKKAERDAKKAEREAKKSGSDKEKN